jgi:hypothetical protein
VRKCNGNGPPVTAGACVEVTTRFGAATWLAVGLVVVGLVVVGLVVVGVVVVGLVVVGVACAGDGVEAIEDVRLATGVVVDDRDADEVEAMIDVGAKLVIVAPTPAAGCMDAYAGGVWLAGVAARATPRSAGPLDARPIPSATVAQPATARDAQHAAAIRPTDM